MPETVQPKQRVHGAGSEQAVSSEPRRKRTAVTSRAFYSEYHGHRESDLEVLLPALRPRAVVWLVGDSSLDNKHWLFNGTDDVSNYDLCAGYEAVVQPPRAAVPDVAYWINQELKLRGLCEQMCCVNTAVEESTLADRAGQTLLAQDQFVRRNIGPEDTLVVSVGGNDVALRPTVATALNMLMLTRSPLGLIRSGWAPGTHHFLRLFRERTMAYVRQLIAERRPRRVVVCTLYYLDPTPGGSWADFMLEKMGYDANPAKLQACIRTIHEKAHLTIDNVSGVEVVAVPLFQVMDGTDTNDYVARVEPSAQGGRKMAGVITDAVLAERPEGGWPGQNCPGAYSGDRAPTDCSIL